jgi:DNA ligase (NAD+)
MKNKVDTSLTIEERKAFLEQEANNYETGASNISDFEWDTEYRAVQEIDPSFSITGGKSENHYAEQYTHEYEMGSLFKDPNPEEFAIWFAKTYPITDGLKAIIDLKIDGCSICCHYDGNGDLVRVVSRGDGVIGCIMPHGEHIKGVLKKIKATGDPIEIKGECYKNQQDFETEGWSLEYANVRNFVSPVTTLKDKADVIKKGYSFVAYEIRGKKFATELEKINFLSELGFETLKDSLIEIDCHGKTADDIAKIVKDYMESFDRETLKYAIDGVVFKNLSIPAGEALGVTNRRPKSSRAIKFPTEQKDTLLLDIQWQMGRVGSLTPVGLLEPVQLAGTTVKRVSLYNLKELDRLGITHYGCTLKVEKAGDIIPKVISKTDNGKEFTPINIPDFCPICDGELVMDDNGVTKWCHYELCAAKVSKNIDHWFKKLNVKGIGEGIINRLCDMETNSFDEPLVSSISSMYNLEHYKSELGDSFGVKATDNILKAVNSVKEVTLGTFIECLGVAQIGRMSHDIADLAQTIDGVDKLTVSDIVALDGFSDIKANKFVTGWSSIRGEIDRILKHITIVEPKAPAGNALDGMKLCFTGSFSNPTRKEMEKMAIEHGGKKGSVGKSLSYLVWDGTIEGNKMTKARDLGLNIISQEEFLEMLK